MPRRHVVDAPRLELDEEPVGAGGPVVLVVRFNVDAATSVMVATLVEAMTDDPVIDDDEHFIQLLSGHLFPTEMRKRQDDTI